MTLQQESLMTEATPESTSGEGTVVAPRFYEGLVNIDRDVRQHRRYFTYQTAEGLVAGYAVSVMFTIGRPAKDIWPHFKDFNRWQHSHHHYSGVVGNLEGKTYRIGSHPGDPGQYDYHVIRVIPEHLIVVSEPVPADGSTGGVSRGFHVFMLNEHEGKTIVSILMEHSFRTQDKSAEDALGYWRGMAPELQTKWRENFIPALKKLVDESR
jgi:uncharacterized protein YndB with AHSA1/START domain